MIGSLVLSEIIKQGTQGGFRRAVRVAIGPCEGWFLDIAKCRLEDGKEPFLSEFFPFAFESLRTKGLNLRDVINSEVQICKPSWCLETLVAEPGMMMFFAGFK